MSAMTPMSATGIGSVPFTDLEETVAMILDSMSLMPYWPQMVRLGFAEEMTPQAAGGLPGLQIDPVGRVVQVDPAGTREDSLAQFYEAALSGELAPFALREEEAHGFFALLAAVDARQFPCTALKGQVSGPVTCAGVIKDPAGKPVLYDRELTQAICLGLGRKAAWQAQKFRELGKAAVVFFDEPYLSGFGSAYLPLSREEVTEFLTQALSAAREFGPITMGLHCCGNTDWGLLLEAPIDILSFDSYGYFDSLRLYDQAVGKFLGRGGWLAWGLVPTGEELERETAETLWSRFQGQVAQLAQDQGLRVKDILSQALVTPACGMGYLSVETARRGLQILGELSLRGRQWLESL
jgi:hypothetical protein